MAWLHQYHPSFLPLEMDQSPPDLLNSDSDEPGFFERGFEYNDSGDFPGLSVVDSFTSVVTLNENPPGVYNIVVPNTSK